MFDAVPIIIENGEFSWFAAKDPNEAQNKGTDEEKAEEKAEEKVRYAYTHGTNACVLLNAHSYRPGGWRVWPTAKRR